MTTITSRSYQGEADLQPIIELLDAYRASDPDDDATTLESLRLEMREPGFDPGRDVRVWTDEDGTLLAYASIYTPEHATDPDGFLWFRVDPALVGSDLEDQIIAWGEERVRERSRERGYTIKLRSGALRQRSDRQAVLARHGMTPVRYFFRMARPLDQPIPEPHFPDGFALAHTNGVDHAAQWVEMFNQSFVDHWNHHPVTVADHLHTISAASYNVERDLIAVAPDGTWAAFCLCWIDPDENAANHASDGWIRVLGTRRGYRKLGLGRAMLLSGLQRLRADGVERAVLGVDAENPTGALRLYESVGFHVIREFVLYSKDV